MTRRRFLLPLFASLAMASAQASEDWRLSAFATLGVAATDSSDAALFRNGINTAGRESPDFQGDSIIGLQASRSVGHGTDLTAQVIIRETQEERIEPRLAWAFARFTPLPEIELRVGRLRSPFFMYSDSIWINYANIWVRPPIEVYGLNPFSDLDGADLMWRSTFIGFDAELRPFAGRSVLDLTGGREARLKRVLGLNLTLHRDELSIHLGHAESPFSLPWGDQFFLTVDRALRASPFAAVSAELSGNDGYARFDSIGAQWDGGTYLFSAEYARRAVNRFTTSAHAWQITAGRRFGPFTTYLTSARQVADEPVTDADLSAIPPLQGALNAFLQSRNTAQHSVTLGLRWDFHRNAALKLEFNRAKIDEASWGSFLPTIDSGVIFLGGRRFDVFSATIDMSF